MARAMDAAPLRVKTVRMNARRLAPLLLIALATAPSPAVASTVEVTDGVMTFTAAPGEANDVNLGAGPTGRSFRAVVWDKGSEVELGAGCTPVDYADAICTGVETIVVLLGDGDDQYGDSESLAQPPKVSGEAGDDVLESRAGVRGRQLSGGPGDDHLEAAGAQADPIVMLGSGGNDSLAVRSHAPSRQYGGKGDDTLLGNRSDDLIRGAAGRDTITGGSGADELYGDAEADTITGGNDADRVESGPGRDSVRLRDGAADTLDCSFSDDLVRFDRGLDTLTGCGGRR